VHCGTARSEDSHDLRYAAKPQKKRNMEGEIDTGLQVFAMQYPSILCNAVLCWGGLLAANTDCGYAQSRYSAVTQWTPFVLCKCSAKCLERRRDNPIAYAFPTPALPLSAVAVAVNAPGNQSTLALPSTSSPPSSLPHLALKPTAHCYRCFNPTLPASSHTDNKAYDDLLS